MIRELTIKPVLNGFVVQAGCQQLVFDSVDKLLDDLKKYYEHPVGVEAYWVNRGLNAKHTLQGPIATPPQPYPTQAGQILCGTVQGAAWNQSDYPPVRDSGAKGVPLAQAGDLGSLSH